MCIGIQALELGTIIKAFIAEEEIIAIFAHPAMLQYLPLAREAFISFILLHLRLEYNLQLVSGLVPTGQR